MPLKIILFITKFEEFYFIASPINDNISAFFLLVLALFWSAWALLSPGETTGIITVLGSKTKSNNSLEVVPFIDSTTPPKTPLLKWLSVPFESRAILIVLKLSIIIATSADSISVDDFHIHRQFPQTSVLTHQVRS